MYVYKNPLVEFECFSLKNCLSELILFCVILLFHMTVDNATNEDWCVVILYMRSDYHDGVFKWSNFPLLALYAGNSPFTGEFPSPRPVTRGFDVFFDSICAWINATQSWGWWFEKPSHSLWRHSNIDSSPWLIEFGKWYWLQIIFCWICYTDEILEQNAYRI